MNDREQIAAQVMAAMIIHEGEPVDGGVLAERALNLADHLLHKSRDGKGSLRFIDPDKKEEEAV